MMRYIFAFIAILCLTSLSIWRAERAFPAPGDILLLGVGGGGTCTQAAVFTALTSGENTSALTNFICGLVSYSMIDADASMAATGSNPYCGSGSVFARLGILAMANTTDGVLDVCGRPSSVLHGSPAFVANQGYTGVVGSTTVYIDTGFNPTTESAIYKQNDAHLGVWILSSVQAVGSNEYQIGLNNSGSTIAARMDAWSTANTATTHMNDGGSSLGPATTTAKGDWIGVRTGSTARALYQNGVSLGSDSAASVGVANGNFYVLALDQLGVGPEFGSPNQVSIWHAGSSMTGTQIANFDTLGCAYLTAVNGSC